MLILQHAELGPPSPESHWEGLRSREANTFRELALQLHPHVKGQPDSPTARPSLTICPLQKRVSSLPSIPTAGEIASTAWSRIPKRTSHLAKTSSSFTLGSKEVIACVEYCRSAQSRRCAFRSLKHSVSWKPHQPRQPLPRLIDAAYAERCSPGRGISTAIHERCIRGSKSHPRGKHRRERRSRTRHAPSAFLYLCRPPCTQAPEQLLHLCPRILIRPPSPHHQTPRPTSSPRRRLLYHRTPGECLRLYLPAWIKPLQQTRLPPV